MIATSTETPRTTTVAEQLEAAADYIEQYGWNQGHYIPGDTDQRASWYPQLAVGQPACALAAVGIANGWESYPSGGTDHPVIRQLDAVVEGGIPTWNDTAGRTRAEVVAAMRMAADLARGGAS